MKYKLRMVGGTQAIERGIVKALVFEASRITRSATRGIEAEIKQRFVDALKETPEYPSLRGEGVKSLRGHFGISDIGDIDEVVYWISSLLEVVHGRAISTKAGIRTGLRLNFNYTNNFIRDVKNFQFGIQPTAKGKNLPWLSWLLFEGGKAIIKEYDVKFRVGAGRSGEAVMYHKVIARWSVPQEFQGTKDDNWITRAIDRLSPRLDAIVEKHFQKRM